MGHQWTSSTYRNLRAPEKGISFFWGGGCQKNGFWQFPSKSTFYPINKFQKVAHEVRATRDIIFRQGSEPIRPYKSPQNAQNHVKISLFWGTITKISYF